MRERREREERETERLREQERIRWAAMWHCSLAPAPRSSLACCAPVAGSCMHCLASQPLPPGAWLDGLGCRAGKELALAARQEEELRLKRMVEARQREKEEEERARAKIKAKLGERSWRRSARAEAQAGGSWQQRGVLLLGLGAGVAGLRAQGVAPTCARPGRRRGAEEDRRERRRRLGLPEELTEEEREEERRKVQVRRPDSQLRCQQERWETGASWQCRVGHAKEDSMVAQSQAVDGPSPPTHPHLQAKVEEEKRRRLPIKPVEGVAGPLWV